MNLMEDTKVITRNPEVLNGAAAFTGRRISVSHMIEHLKAGWTVSDYADEMALPVEQVRAALDEINPDPE